MQSSLGFCDYVWIGNRNGRVLAASHISLAWAQGHRATQLEFIEEERLAAIASRRSSMLLTRAGRDDHHRSRLS